MEKIEWYREALALEPGSKLFFQLARMLAQQGKPEEACEVLSEGTARNKDFFEARLLYVDTLERAGRRKESMEQALAVAQVLSRYAGFWKAWALACEERGAKDSSLALQLLSASFENDRPFSLVDLLLRGLKHRENEKLPPAEEEPAPKKGVFSRKAALEPLARPAVSLAKAPSERAEPQGAKRGGVANAAHEELPKALEEPAAARSEPAAFEDDLADEDLDDVVDEDLDGDFSSAPLLTKSMAAVLMDQGDLQGALSIYEGLLEKGGSADEKADLALRIAGLKERIAKEAEEAEDFEEDSASEPDVPLQTKSMAEVLAGQGDLQGALSIYEGLLEKSASIKEKADFVCRIAEIKERIAKEREEREGVSLAVAEPQGREPAASSDSGVQGPTPDVSEKKGSPAANGSPDAFPSKGVLARDALNPSQDVRNPSRGGGDADVSEAKEGLSSSSSTSDSKLVSFLENLAARIESRAKG